jgi:hypothetical protein
MADRNQHPIQILAPSRFEKPPVLEARHPVQITDPGPLKNAICGSIERDVFPYVDSRTRSWRYYLLIGPRRGSWSHPGIARRLLNIVKANTPRRGLGRNLLSKYERLGKRIPDQRLKGLGARFFTEYGVASNFWEHVKVSGDGRAALERASGAVRRATQAEYHGFFDEGKGSSFPWARKAFHRIIRVQSDESKEIARILYRNGWDVRLATTTLNFQKVKSDPVRRLFLTWALLPALYENLSFIDFEDEEAGAAPVSADNGLAELARAAIRGLSVGLKPDLDPRTREKLVALLRVALAKARRNKGVYRPPLTAPPLPPGQTRQRVFADVRLSSFARLLRSTAR